MCFYLIPLFLFFPAGAFNDNTKNEEVANQMAVAATKKTTGGQYLSILVEPNDVQTNPLNSPSSEFYSTYAYFGEQSPAFAGTVNADKTNSIYIKEIETQNLSFLYSNINSNKEYKGHFKHEFYPLELMFKGDHVFADAFSFCYLSETQARNLLISRGLEINEETFKSLIGQKIIILFNNVEYTYSIGNIYLETNYYYSALSEVLGDFIFSYIRYPEGIKKQACYFMNRYYYQNLSFMKRISALYDNKQYSIKINHNNLKEDIDDVYLTSFYFRPKNHLLDILSALLFVFLLLNNVVSSLLVSFINFNKRTWRVLLYPIFGLLPYLIFLIVSHLTKSFLFFSGVSTIIFFAVLLSHFIFSIIVFFKYFNKGERCL